MINLEHLYKTYSSNLKYNALNDVSLKISKGDIFGIIGFSGAGKSTLLRTINLLEKPTKGNVIVDGETLNNLNSSNLAKSRKQIGMIFQHFNLLNSKTIYKNIALPLELNKTPKEIIKKRVEEVAELVKLENHLYKYPNTLSGGQKQRVGIARALTTNPKILLCDEATSALDPSNTLSILELLKEINNKIGLTIVLITHEIQVIKAICNKLAVIDKGRIVEVGKTKNVFNNPKNNTTKILLNYNPKLTADYNYIIHVYLNGNSTDMNFIKEISEIGNINITESNIYKNKDFLEGSLTFKFKAKPNFKLDILKDILIKYKLKRYSIRNAKV